ncbi:hypothetical protein SEA_PEGGYLEG03_67 [Arthrobacter phage PeggyLeg03]|nr:hypothetical protein SEA_PEGGYLEG03_67 [Arthrobacter phage PeggyLeg03]
MTTTEENLEWIYTRWTDLRATILRGTPKPWREPTLTAEQRAHIDALARTEKLERGAFTLGESPAPVHLDALDQAIELTQTMRRLARAAATELGHHAVLIRAATHRYDDPLLLIRYLKAHWQQVAAELGETIQDEAATIRARLTYHFAEVPDGQRLKADCPYCDQPTLHLRVIGPKHRGEPVIRCESGTCEPDEGSCGTWHRGMPAWPFHEWDWLVKQIQKAEERRATEREEQLQKVS